MRPRHSSFGSPAAFQAHPGWRSRSTAPRTIATATITATPTVRGPIVAAAAIMTDLLHPVPPSIGDRPMFGGHVPLSDA